MSEYPEHEKLKALNGANNIVGSFLDWLDEQGWTIAQYPEGADHLTPVYMSKSAMLAKHFEIDENKLENEKRHMLKGCRIARGEDP